MNERGASTVSLIIKAFIAMYLIVVIIGWTVRTLEAATGRSINDLAPVLGIGILIAVTVIVTVVKM